MKRALPGSRMLCTVGDARMAPQRVLCAGRALVVWMAGERPAVLDDRCPHGNARLSAGYVLDGRIVCPAHMWGFAPDGTAHVPGTDVAAPVAQSYECWISGDRIWVCLPHPVPQHPGAAIPV